MDSTSMKYQLRGNILDIRGLVKYEDGRIDFRKLRERMKEEIAKDVIKNWNFDGISGIQRREP